MSANDFNFSLGHIGIWHDKDGEAERTAKLMVDLFGFDSEEIPWGWHLDNNHFEIIKKPGRGTRGHFSILCDDIVAAKKYLEEEKGVVFDEDTCAYTKDGQLWKVFAHDEISGFAWHLAQRGKAYNGH